MKTKQFIYLTTVFSLGISTIATALFPQSSNAVTKNHQYLLNSNQTIFAQDKNSLSQNQNSLSRLETQNSFDWSQESATQIAQAYRGKASWYGPKFHGRLTANGEIFDSNALTAAHRSLPFGTKVRVTNLSNGLSVIVRINDRGPFIKGRIIDVSAGAAQRLKMVSSGVANVQIEILGR